MRKIIVITAIVTTIALLLTGCGIRNQASKSNVPNPKTTSQAGTDANQTTGGTSIVAKSENIMSSSDKEELLNQVDKELDSLFSNISKLEDTQDADLDLNQK